MVLGASHQSSSQAWLEYPDACLASISLASAPARACLPQVSGQVLETPRWRNGQDHSELVSDFFVLSNASCVLLGLFTPGLYAVNLPDFTVHLVDEETLLDNINASGQIRPGSSLETFSVASCDGLACDAASGRWLLVDGLDASRKMHILGQPTSDKWPGELQVWWLHQAFSSPGACVSMHGPLFVRWLFLMACS